MANITNQRPSTSKFQFVFPGLAIIGAALLGLMSFAMLKSGFEAVNNPSKVAAEKKKWDDERYAKLHAEWADLGGGNRTVNQKYLGGELEKLAIEISKKGDYSAAVAEDRNAGFSMGIITGVGCLFLIFKSVRLYLASRRSEGGKEI